MSAKQEHPSVFEQIKAGLADSIAYSRGELSLATTSLPAPPPSLSPKEIAAVRRRLRMSQAVFAATLNVSKRTVQSWEQGRRRPADAALRMLQVVGLEPRIVRKVLSIRVGTSLKYRVSPKRRPAPRAAAKRAQRATSKNAPR